jgi:hypothetical protein
MKADIHLDIRGIDDERICCPARAAICQLPSRFNQTLLRVWMRFVFADGVLAAVNNSHAFAEETHLASPSAQPCAERGLFSSHSSSAWL